MPPLFFLHRITKSVAKNDNNNKNNGKEKPNEQKKKRERQRTARFSLSALFNGVSGEKSTTSLYLPSLRNSGSSSPSFSLFKRRDFLREKKKQKNNRKTTAAAVTEVLKIIEVQQIEQPHRPEAL